MNSCSTTKKEFISRYLRPSNTLKPLKRMFALGGIQHDNSPQPTTRMKRCVFHILKLTCLVTKKENIKFYRIVSATYKHKRIVRKNKGHIHTKFKNPCKKGFKLVKCNNGWGVLHCIKKHDLNFKSFKHIKISMFPKDYALETQ
jgi:hypothetical protein